MTYIVEVAFSWHIEEQVQAGQAGCVYQQLDRNLNGWLGTWPTKATKEKLSRKLGVVLKSSNHLNTKTLLGIFQQKP